MVTYRRNYSRELAPGKTVQSKIQVLQRAHEDLWWQQDDRRLGKKGDKKAKNPCLIVKNRMKIFANSECQQRFRVVMEFREMCEEGRRRYEAFLLRREMLLYLVIHGSHTGSEKRPSTK